MFTSPYHIVQRCLFYKQLPKTGLYLRLINVHSYMFIPPPTIVHRQAALQKGPHYATRISVEEKRQEQIFDIPIFRRHSVLPQHFFLVFSRVYISGQ